MKFTMGSTTALEQPLEHTPHGITKGYMRYGYTMGAVHTFVSSSPLSPFLPFLDIYQMYNVFH